MYVQGQTICPPHISSLTLFQRRLPPFQLSSHLAVPRTHQSVLAVPAVWNIFPFKTYVLSPLASLQISAPFSHYPRGSSDHPLSNSQPDPQHVGPACLSMCVDRPQTCVCMCPSLGASCLPPRMRAPGGQAPSSFALCSS